MNGPRRPKPLPGVTDLSQSHFRQRLDGAFVAETSFRERLDSLIPASESHPDYPPASDSYTSSGSHGPIPDPVQGESSPKRRLADFWPFSTLSRLGDGDLGAWALVVLWLAPAAIAFAGTIAGRWPWWTTFAVLTWPVSVPVAGLASLFAIGVGVSLAVVAVIAAGFLLFFALQIIWVILKGLAEANMVPPPPGPNASPEEHRRYQSMMQYRMHQQMQQSQQQHRHHPHLHHHPNRDGMYYY